MKWGMDILSPAPNTSWLIEENNKSTSKWTPAENKAFENALAIYDKDTSDRWQRVAEMVPGKTEFDVFKQYKELEDDVNKIEAGLISLPGYTNTFPFTLEWGYNHHRLDGYKHSFASGGKRSSTTRPPEQERKKGVPWTEEEHKLFLMGLKKYGKGDWRNISRNFVITRTPTQVASHAQKYFIRQLSGGKDKRRASIHDITTVNLNDNQTPSPEQKNPMSPDQSIVMSHQQNSAAQKMPFQWNNGSFNTAQGSLFMSPPNYGVNSYGFNKMQSESLPMHEPYFGSQSLSFQLQSAQQYHLA